MPGNIDLHTHTSRSDGTDSPAVLAEKAGKAGLSALAVTDHDTVAGVAEALAAGHAAGVEVIPGVELSVWAGREIHIVGLMIDHENGDLLGTLAELRRTREERNRKIVGNIRADGLPARLPDSGEKSVTRAHIAGELVRLGAARDRRDAFARFLSPGGRYYAERERLAPGRAIALIGGAGGLAVLAHINRYRLDAAGARALVGELRDTGLGGLEVLYPEYDAATMALAASLADEFALLPSGGSDYHGANKPVPLGAPCCGVSVPYVYIDHIRKKLDK